MGENYLEQKSQWDIYNGTALASHVEAKIQPLASVENIHSYIKYKLFQSLTDFQN